LMRRRAVARKIAVAVRAHPCQEKRRTYADAVAILNSGTSEDGFEWRAYCWKIAAAAKRAAAAAATAAATAAITATAATAAVAAAVAET